MTLENLFRTGQLAEHETDARQVRRMLAAARRCVQDSRSEAISPETRMDAAYRAIMQASMVALWANDYRPSRSSPGHHMTLIQTLTTSVGLDRNRMLLIDTFRVKRNAIDYTGDDVDTGSVASCANAADHLIDDLERWLARNRPDLID